MAFEHDGLCGGIGHFQIPQTRGAVSLPVTTQRLSGLKATAQTDPHGLEHDGLGGGIGRFQIPETRGVVRQLPVTTQRLSGLKATANHPHGL